tara:strand:+ start:324 stop:1442 length:1119 start_codon:yes stop_codon:yes gene_type:complete
MNISKNIFHHKKLFTIGVEEEYMLCDSISGDLVDKADEIMNMIQDSIRNRYSYELLLSEIEINTTPCETVSEIIDEISQLRTNTIRIGEKLDFKLGISGTHPTAIAKDQKFVQNTSYKWVANQLGYYAKRNITFAMHVHVAVKNENYAISIANSLRRWISPLLALSTNSPFFEGELTGMKSSRTMQFGAFPRTNIPQKFENFEEYKGIVENHIVTNAIEKPRQIWWKIRPHMDFGTIEFRICDVQRSMRNVEMLTAICQALVYQSSLDYENQVLPESFNLEYLNDALWKSARFSFDAKVIDPDSNSVSTISDQINKMKSYIQKALEYFGNSHINNQINYILSNGTEGDRQIEVYNNQGYDGLKKFLIDNVES